MIYRLDNETGFVESIRDPEGKKFGVNYEDTETLIYFMPQLKGERTEIYRNKNQTSE